EKPLSNINQLPPRVDWNASELSRNVQLVMNSVMTSRFRIRMALFFFNRHSHLQRSCNSSPGILADIQLSSPDIFFMKNRKMQIVRIAAENFLYRIVKIMPDDDFDLLEFGDALLREASVGGMPVSGALQLHYRFNRPVGQADEVHLALPVRAFAEDYDGLFHLKRTESFCCITDVVHGNIGAFTERWRKLERCASML